MPSNKPITTGVRLPAQDRIALDHLAERFENTPAGLIRLAVNNLLAATKANGGQLPPSVRAMRRLADHPEAAAALAGERK